MPLYHPPHSLPFRVSTNLESCACRPRSIDLDQASDGAPRGTGPSCACTCRKPRSLADATSPQGLRTNKAASDNEQEAQKPIRS